MPASTLHRCPVRRDLILLSRVDRQTGQPIRRYERTRPGELVHVDVKKTSTVHTSHGLPNEFADD